MNGGLCEHYRIAELEQQLTAANARVEALTNFANAVLFGLDGCPTDIDGYQLQELALKHGLLREQTMDKPCGEYCECANICGSGEFPMECYRATDFLAALEQEKGDEGS
jgi:hypothetical protein